MAFVGDLPRFCLERWQSERETKARILLSESGVEPLKVKDLEEIAGPVDFSSLDLGYGWTKGDPRLRRLIAEYYGWISEDNVLVTNGSAEANFLAVMSLVAPGHVVLVDMPNYMQVHGLLKARGAEVFEAWRSSRNGWHIPLDEILYAIRKVKPKALFLTNPNNPTGSVEVDSLKALVEEAAANNTVVVVDEVYRGLEHSSVTPPSIIELASRHGAIGVSTSGLSKVYGLPGLRVGWLASNDERLIEKAWSVKDYTTIGPSRLSEAVAIKAMQPGVRGRLIERARAIVKGSLSAFKEALEEKSGLLEPWWPEAGAFILVAVPWARDTWSLAQAVFETRGVLVNPGECFDLPGTLRIGLGHGSVEYSRTAYSELLEAIAEYRKNRASS